MIDDRQEELASLHAFNLLEGAEKDAFLAEIAGNPELAKHVAGMCAAATAMAHAAPDATPPAELRARVLASAARVGASAKATAQQPVEMAPVALFPTWIPWLAAACLSVATILAGRKYAVERHQYANMADQAEVTRVALDQARSELADTKHQLSETNLKVIELTAKLRDEGDLAHFKISTLASMLGNSPAAVAVAVWDPSRERGVLSVSNLPAAASEKDYQLWVIDKQYPTPVSAGTFVVDPATGEAHVVFKADKPVNSIAKFAVSVERKGGSDSPQGPIILISP
jgi:anti-sigma-K factor RskA